VSDFDDRVDACIAMPAGYRRNWLACSIHNAIIREEPQNKELLTKLHRAVFDQSFTERRNSETEAKRSKARYDRLKAEAK
jgi:hypothetical protein